MSDTIDINIPFPYCRQGGGCTIDELSTRSCRWPLATVHSRPPYLYCNERTMSEGCSYCRTHFLRSTRGGGK